MATLGGYYLDPHKSQYDPDSTASTRQMGCVPTTGANGANASTGGRVAKTGQQVHNLVPREQEYDPHTLGWAMPDLDLAMARLGVPFENRTGDGWSGLLTALDHGLYVAAQGDSDQFSNNTCSGEFDGDHMIGIHPATRVVSGLRQHFIDDPICRFIGRWEYDYIIRRYMTKLASNIRFGVFTHPVPKAAVSTPTVTLRYGGAKIVPITKRIAVAAGTKANVRSRPTTSAPVMVRLANGQTFKAYQRTKTGQLLAGSRVWYGNAAGTRWLHITAF